ncbi:calponin homology domain-containing protein DDB_G0272472-like [Limulus polyphemus]|uniref:Calponin homology domain-containing protein DDB_G0272472-like n=1 Tax=Limulus polyphemus TaxID=6850 RepID=A0ABM1BMC7_LIMPO|nr:calponin homology domain-containing protein DDB_G0272472-like [Limulus polyphemus]
MKVKWNRRLDGFPRRDQRPLSTELEYEHVDESDVSVSLQDSEEFFDEHKNKKPKRGRFLNIFKLITKKQKSPEFETKIRNEKSLQSQTDYSRCQYHTSLLPTNVESSGSSTSVAIEDVLLEVMAAPKDPTQSEEAVTANSSRGKSGNIQTSATLSSWLDPNIACQEKNVDEKDFNWETTSVSSTDSNSEGKTSSEKDDRVNDKPTFDERTNIKNHYSEIVTCQPKQRRSEEEHLIKIRSLEMVKHISDISKNEKSVKLTTRDLQESSTCASASHSKTLLNLPLSEEAESKEINKKMNTENYKFTSSKSTIKQTKTDEDLSTKKNVDALKAPEKAIIINKNQHKTQQHVRFVDQLPEGADTWSCKSSSSVITTEISPLIDDEKDSIGYRDEQETETKDVKQKRHMFRDGQAKKSARESKRKDIFPPKFTANLHETKARGNTYLEDEKPKDDFLTDLDFSKTESVKITRTGWSSQDMIVLGTNDPPQRMGNHPSTFRNQKERSVDLVRPDSQKTAQNEHEKPDIVTSCGPQMIKKKMIVSSPVPSDSPTPSTSSPFHKTGDIKRGTCIACHLPQTTSGQKEDTPAPNGTKTCNFETRDSQLENVKLPAKYSDVSSLTLSQLEILVLQWIHENGNPLYFSEKKERRPGLPAEQRKSRREYVQEIQRLGALCETRTKELKLLKIQLKHAFLGFDSFSIVVKYLTEELDALSHPRILSELKKTRDDLQKTEAQLRRYETHLEQLKRNHEDEIQELTSKLAATHREEIETLIVNHQEELRKLQDEHDKEVEDLKTIHAQSAKDAQSRNSLSVAALKEQHNRLIEDLEKDFANQMQQAVESHEKALDSLKQQLQDLQKQCEDLQLEKKQMESSLQEDTNTKLQWVLAQKSNLQKEVESLQTVLELKVADIHHLRTENLEMQKELEKLPSARQEIQKLKARNEDLQAMVDEKVRIERQLASESLHLKEEFEKEFKSKSRLSMEKEELQWRLKQTMEASALLSTMSDSSSEILDKLLHDESLLKSPVRMSVFLNELDTSLTQGGRSPGNHRQVTAGGRPPNTMSNPENCRYSGRPSSRSSPPTPIAKKLRCSNQSDSVGGTPKRSRSNKSPIRETNRSDHSSAIEVCDAQNPTNGHAENDDLTPKQQRMSYYTSSVNVSQKNLSLNAPHPENNEDEESYSMTSDHHHCTKSDVFCPERRMVFSNSPESSLSVCQGKGPSLLEFTDNEAHGSREKEQHKSKSET